MIESAGNSIHVLNLVKINSPPSNLLQHIITQIPSFISSKVLWTLIYIILLIVTAVKRTVNLWPPGVHPNLIINFPNIRIMVLVQIFNQISIGFLKVFGCNIIWIIKQLVMDTRLGCIIISCHIGLKKSTWFKLASKKINLINIF